MNKLPNDVYDRSRAFATVVGAKGGSPLRILITSTEEWATTASGQLVLLALCDIIPRISERYTLIDLCVPEAAQSFSWEAQQGSPLASALHRRLKAVCPWGQFSIISAPKSTYDFCISVGATKWNASPQAVYLSTSGWRCFVSRDSRFISASGGNLNPFACLATAAFGAMAIYAEAEKLPPERVASEIHGWSLFDFSVSAPDGPPLPCELNVGTVVQAGLGGSANALLWALRFGPRLRGRWFAFEHENLDFSNSNRYLLMTPVDIDLPKALLAKREFEPWQLQLNFQAVQGRIEECCGQMPADATVLATVDDESIRIHLQRQYPALLLNVGTGSQYLSVSCHPLQEIRKDSAACVNCLFRDPQTVERRQREATVSFVSALLGALLGAELVKNLAFQYQKLRYAWLGHIFEPAAARPYLPAKFRDCPTCSILTEV